MLIAIWLDILLTQCLKRSIDYNCNMERMKLRRMWVIYPDCHTPEVVIRDLLAGVTHGDNFVEESQFL